MPAVLSTVPRGIGNAHVFTYQGVPLDRVAKMLGHAGLGLRLRLRYAHFSVEDLNPALDAVSAMEKRGGERTVNEKGDVR